MIIKVKEMFGSVDDMLSKDQQRIVKDAFDAVVKEIRHYAELCLPSGHETTCLIFGNPYYCTIGTEKPNAGRYDPDKFGPYLFNCKVDFTDNSLNGGSNKIKFHLDAIDPQSGEKTIQKDVIAIDVFVDDFFGMKKPEFIIQPTDTDKIESSIKRAFRIGRH